MPNEKNTQNADMLTKDTRQYKHTPSKRKLLVGKIFALVGCLAVLLSCLVLPSSADCAQKYPYAEKNPYLPSRMSVPYAGIDAQLEYITSTIPSCSGYYPTTRNLYWDTIYSLTDDTAVEYYYRYFQEEKRYVLSLELESPSATQFDGSHTNPWVLDYDPFYYTPDVYDYLPSNVSTPDGGTVCYFEFVSDSSFMNVQTDYYIAYTDVESGQSNTATATAYSANLDAYINLQGFFDKVGISDSSIMVDELTVQFKAETADDFIYLYGYHFYVESGFEVYDYPFVVKQVINSGSATSFVEFLEDTVGGFLGLNLFTFGMVNVTPGAILSVFGGVAILVWLLKLFLGG